MPAKRKKKATPKKKNTNTSGLSSGASSESESSNTLKIQKKIPQKLMGPCQQKNGRRKQAVSEIGYEADEEASTTGTSDMSTQSPAPAESSLYDFDEQDYEMQISPMPVKSKKTKAKTSTTRSKALSTDKKQKTIEPAAKKGKKTNGSVKNSITAVKLVKSKSSVLKKTNKHNQENSSTSVKSLVETLKTRQGRLSVSSSVSNSPIFSKTPVVTLQRLDVSNVEGYESFQRQLRKRKCETPKDQTTPQVKPKVLKTTPILKNVTLSGKNQQRKRDSGVLMSTPSLHKIPAPAARDTSTPSNVAPRGKPKQPTHSLLNESCFGFDSVSFAADTSSHLSHVKRKAVPPLTPLSDYASMDSMQISYDDIFRRQSMDNDVDVPELFSMEQDDLSLNRSTTKSYKLASKRRPKKEVSTTSKSAVLKKLKADDVAEKLNTEFDEIEKFQLSIEEM